MSRGPGRWQRILLAALDRCDPLLVADAVEDALGRQPTRVELVAARRAAHSLMFGRDLAHVTRVWIRDAWDRPQPHLALTRRDDLILRDLMAWALSDAS